MLVEPDIRSLNGMLSAIERVGRTRLVPFGPRAMLEFWIAAALPMIPLAAAVTSTEKLLEKIGEGLLAGLPV
jgi:hypothetical protein